MELNLDGLVLIATALFYIVLAFIIQFAWLCIFKSKIIRRLPMIIFLSIWIVCVLGSLNIIDLPRTSTIIDGGFITIKDYQVIATIGVPTIIGFALAWGIHVSLQARKERKQNQEDPK
jgi:hypothetical protein